MLASELVGSNDNILFHSVKAKNAVKQLDSGIIEGHTHQRYWPDGLRRKDNHPEYKDSFILKGISTTRDIEYAKGWGDVIYLLDKDKIRHHFKVIPYSWGYSIPQSITPYMGQTLFHKFRHKREREEFVVLATIEKSFDQLEQEWIELYSIAEEPVEPFVNMFDYKFGKKGKIDLNNILKGILIVNKDTSLTTDEDLETIKKHPKFKGFVNPNKQHLKLNKAVA